MNKLQRLWFPAVLLFITLAGGGNGQAGAPHQGQTPAAPVPPAKKQNLTYEDRQAWQRILKWSEECEEEYRRQREAGYDDKGQWLQFHQLEPKRYLVEVICFLAAYQTNMRFFYYDETKSPPFSTPLTFKIYDKVGKKISVRQVEEFGGFSEFDPQTKELVIDTKFRGLGDCGFRAVYRIKNGRAVLQEFRAKFDCDGKVWDPAKGPIIYKEK